LPGKNLSSLFNLRLPLNRSAGKRNRLEARARDRLPGYLTDAVAPRLNPLQRTVDLEEGVLFQRQKMKGEIAVAGIAAGVAVVRGEGGTVARIRTGILCDGGHRGDQPSAQLEQFFFLREGKSVEAFAWP
jgi:hypothetical protein